MIATLTDKTLQTYRRGRRSKSDGPLTERYRPRRLLDVVGQDQAVQVLRAFAAKPFPTAFLFEGWTGTGKTSGALALAAEIGCDVTQKPPEFGGLHTIASGEQTAESVRDLYNQMWRCPFSGSGWKVLIVNEADRMNTAVETIWLDRLESVPPTTVIVFTTNSPANLSQRFRDRCTRVVFESDAVQLDAAARRLIATVWRAERHRRPSNAVIDCILQGAVEGGRVSFRRVVQRVASVSAARASIRADVRRNVR